MKFGPKQRFVELSATRKPPAIQIVFALTLLFVCLPCPPVRADVGVVLNESLNTSIARITGSGHTAVYLSRVCPESPIRLRLCHAGELGSVISNYTSLGEDQPFEWNAVPLNIYLYGVESSHDRPMFGSPGIKTILEERYRDRYLSKLCTTEACRTSNKAEWREMVGASLSRSMYIFVVATTVEQDEKLIEQFNSVPNENHFNGMRRNCADFAKRIVNGYFPHATGADYINDFGMTSPKAVARSFTRYALRRHPEAHFRILHVAQVPGTIKRSTQVRTGTEQLYRSKKLLLPMVLFAAHELPAVAASYLLIGRFNPQRASEQYPTIEASQAEFQLRQAKSAKQPEQVERLQAEWSDARERVVGTPREWRQYRLQFDAISHRALEEENVSASELFKSLGRSSTISAEPNGRLWTEISRPEGTVRVGLSASNILASGSNSHLAYQLMLARNEHMLKSPKHSRETMAEFRTDWELLQRAARKEADSFAAKGVPVKNDEGDPLGADGRP